MALSHVKALAIHSDFDQIAIGSRETITVHKYNLGANKREEIGACDIHFWRHFGAIWRSI
ncbi:hypothetical protein OSTOST_08223 [Ostertagia ostertagi]